ncbi:MAG: hypothetical protein J6K25_15295 [Thermoguttaceae bacterium]|nr:hypothetical protein [Thermoguttaceae bacterium]
MGEACVYCCEKCGHSRAVLGDEGVDSGFRDVCQVRCATCREIVSFSDASGKWDKELSLHKRRIAAGEFSTSEEISAAFTEFVAKILPKDAVCSRCGGLELKPLGDLEKLSKLYERPSYGPEFEFLFCPQCDGKMKQTSLSFHWD